MPKKRKRSMPVMILWDRRQQQRFVDAVERFVSLVGDLEMMMAAKKRRSSAAAKANITRREVFSPPLEVNGQIIQAVRAEGETSDA